MTINSATASCGGIAIDRCQIGVNLFVHPNRPVAGHDHIAKRPDAATVADRGLVFVHGTHIDLHVSGRRVDASTRSFGCVAAHVRTGHIGISSTNPDATAARVGLRCSGVRIHFRQALDRHITIGDPDSSPNSLGGVYAHDGIDRGDKPGGHGNPATAIQCSCGCVVFDLRYSLERHISHFHINASSTRRCVGGQVRGG